MAKNKQTPKVRKITKGVSALPYLILVFTALILAAALFCVLRTRQDNTAQTVQPDSAYKGYYSSLQQASGGSDLNNVSIYDVNVAQEKDDLVISMQFSYNNASSEGSIAVTNLVPAYTVEVLPQPYRLAITFENVSEWTFTGKTSWLEHALLQGAFVAPPTYESADNPTVIFHLTDDVAYKIEEDGGTLKIYLRQTDAPQTRQCYVLLNGLSEYASYAAVRALSLTPSLCSDSEHTLLISHGFESEADAEAFIARIDETIQEYLPGKSAFLQWLAPEQLPDFPEDLELQEISAMPVIWRNAQSQTAEALEINAGVLCISPDEDVILCNSPVYTLDMSSGETVYSEILYFSNETDTYQKLTDQEFSMILYAQFSSDGRYVAFLDYDSDNNVTTLYCFDRQSDSMVSFAQDAFGTFVYDFIFDSASRSIYAVTLESDSSIVVRRCDIATSQSDVLFSLNASVGMLAADQNALYFADTDENGEHAVVYRTSDNGATRQSICDASRFIVSSDGRFLAAESSDGLNIIDLSSAERIALLLDVQISDFHFSGDGQTLVCIAQPQSAQNDKYPGDVYLWHAAQNTFEYQFSTACTDILFSVEDDCVLLNSTYYTQSSYIPVVYRVNLQ